MIRKSFDTIKFKTLDWDSRFFDLKIAELKLGNYIIDQHLMDDIKSSKFDLVYLFSKKEIPEVLSNAGYSDIKITYSKILDGTVIKEIPDNIIPFQGVINKELENLALLAGKYSRFCLDDLLRPFYKRFYRTWIKNSINKEIADVTYVYKENNNIYGLITVKRDKDSATIGLIAVNVEEKNKGIGRNLMVAAERWAKTNGLFKINVATQKRNKEACGFYEKVGYDIMDIDYIYHFGDKYDKI
jgi:dTDP-4-amino-4,6-dideoxy-D-galactose acyltransferase